jgi:hypothetical protein
MTRSLITGAALLFVAVSLPAQDGIQRGKIKKVDADKSIVTITVDGKDQDFTFSRQTKILGLGKDPGPKDLGDGKIPEGVEVMFKAVAKDGKNYLIGLRIGAGSPKGLKGTPGGKIRRAKIKKIDLGEMVLTLTLDGKDREFPLAENTLVLDTTGKNLKERLKGFKSGAPVFFKTDRRDGKEVIVALKLAAGGPGKGDLPKFDSSKLKPLTELGTEKYQGFQGGLYPDGKNERPKAHEAAGQALARQVRPLNQAGKPDSDGKIVLLSVGMSNTAQASQGFERRLAKARDVNPHVVFLNGAQGGMTAFAIQDPEDGGRGTQYWTTVDERLKDAGLSPAQVQVIWIKQADAGPSQGFPAYAKTLQGELARIVQLLPGRFPNLKLVYLSGRTYAGYARTRLNPEPYAYESGFSVKWLIEQQIKGDPALNYDAKKGKVTAPWLSWGPYLWANGATKRTADGFSWEESDFAGDGTHHAAGGVAKLGNLLLEFFKTDSTTRMWFLR